MTKTPALYLLLIVALITTISCSDNSTDPESNIIINGINMPEPAGQLTYLSSLDGETVGDSHDLDIYEHFVIMAAYGISVVDISEPSSPRLATRFVRDGGEGIFIYDDYAFLAKGVGIGFDVFRLADDGGAVSVGGHEFCGWKIAAFGIYAYSHGYIFDISDYGNIVMVDSTYSFKYPTVSDDYLFAIGTIFPGGSFYWYDITNAPDLSLLGSFFSDYSYNVYLNHPDLFIEGDYAYIAGGSVIEIIDISTPGELVSSAVIQIAHNLAQGVFVRNDSLFVAEGDYGLQLYDVSNKSAPVLLDEYTDINSAYLRAVRVIGNLVVLSFDTNGLLILYF